MNMPGFTADSSLYVSTRHYRGGSNNRGAVSNVVFPSQIGGGIPCVVACVEWALRYTPPGGTVDYGAIVATCAVACGIPYSYQLYTSVMATVFSAGGGGGAIAGGAAGAGGIPLWMLLPGVIVGVALGAAGGFGTEYILTPEDPTPGAPLGCTRTGPHTMRNYTGSYWGCRRSYAKTLNDIENRCRSLTGQCAGTCPSGAPCTPTAIVHDIGQIRRFPYVFCDTWVWYECGCGC
jgi:hypothetical protein